MTRAWSWYVIALVVLNVGGSAWLLFWARTKKVDAGAADQTMGHAFDGIEEYDLPLPRWWLWMFVGTIVFTVVYLILYPGFGNLPGTLGWSQQGQYEEEVRLAEAKYGPMYAALAARPIEELAGDPVALGIGQRLFANHCATCHGADARGGPGFPNLADHDWLFGGTPDAIKASILYGRKGFMPPFAPALGGEQGIKEVVQYVLGLSGQDHDAAMAEAGKPRFTMICGACHGADGKGNLAMGAPNLTDDIWLFGGTAEDIEYGLHNGRMAEMPAHLDILGEQRGHLVAAWVYSLSQGDAAASGGGAGQ
jgi:cytochrome c oxidase cbb3-type subunit 3